MIESLTSYLSRLAWEHRLSLSCLLERLIAPITGKKYVIKGGARILSGAFSGYFRAINGTGDTAVEWVGYLEQLTMREDLSCLTLRKWRHVLSQRELLRQHKAWCSECFGEQLASRESLYEPLLWSIAAVRVCPRHQQTLRTRCPRCRQHLFKLSRRSRPGQCYRCGSGLQRRECCTSTVGEWDLWSATAAARLLASHRTFDIEPENETIALGVRTIVETAFHGNAAQFARAIGKQKNTVWGWGNDGSRIRVVDLLALCYCLRIDPLDFLAPTFPLTFTRPTSLRSLITEGSQRVKPRPVNLALVEKRLRRILAREGTPSMQQVALSLDRHKRLLYRRLPDLCRAIARKHRQSSRTVGGEH